MTIKHINRAERMYGRFRSKNNDRKWAWIALAGVVVAFILIY